jgi:hypothetical protein
VHPKKPLENIAGAPGSIAGIILFQINDGSADRFRQPGSGLRLRLIDQPLFTIKAVIFSQRYTLYSLMPNRRCQGLAVAYYGGTLGALTLKPSGFCNIGVKRLHKN